MYHPDWLNFIDAINKAKSELGFDKNEECFYRGHTQKNWEFSPGLFRNIVPYKDKYITADCWDIESDLYYEFRSRARALNSQQVNDWDILFIMQHHGVRTRILDWTEMLSSALYFPLEGCDRQGNLNGSSPCIWLMNPYKLNEVYHGLRELWDPEFLNIYDEGDA
jgi:hypothetical protein